jgi:signal transduction histidine kinase
MNYRLSARYFLASIALLVVLVAFYAWSTARRTQAELSAQLTDKGLALAEALEISSRNAIRSNALVEEMIAERLADNARLVDELLRRPFDPAELGRLGARNRLRRIDLLDLDGKPWAPPPLPPPGMGRMLMGPRAFGEGLRPPGERPRPHGETPGLERPMMRYMWGRRWARAERPEGEAAAPSAIKDRKFWEGSVFGVAIGASSFRGLIAVHADADYILNFRREIGVERQIEELGRQSGVAAVALLGPELTVLAHSDATRIGQSTDEAALARALGDRRGTSRLVERASGARVLEVVRPVTVGGARLGLLSIELSTEPMERAWRQDLHAGLGMAGAVLGLGAVGLGLIFWAQQRHLREVRELETRVAGRERLAALGDVAAAFAHEVRNPLNAVSIGLQRLHAEFRPDPADEYERFVTLMQGEVRRLNAIVEQFIALARPLPLEPASFALDDLVEELGVLVDGEAKRAGVAVRLDLEPDLPPLVADRDHVKQVLLNLVLNALQASARGGTVTLGASAVRGRTGAVRGRTGAAGDRVLLTVADTGAGIAPEVLPRIFDPYFTTRRGGLGLGLTITRRIVEAHGGAIEVESQPGRGSRFRVSLPLAPP